MLRTFGGARIVTSSQLVGGDVDDGWSAGNVGDLGERAHWEKDQIADTG